MVLPCANLQIYVDQIPRAIDLLRAMDARYPKVLQENGINPLDYHQNLVFRSAVESIRGTYAATIGNTREAVIKAALETMQQSGLIKDSRKQPRTRYDQQVLLSDNPRILAALEVKGGEGNSIQVSERPLWAQEFILWCHLDGSIGHSPGRGAFKVLSRIAADIVTRGKLVDAALTRDSLCGTSTRPCPKYFGTVPPTPLGVAPDVFLFPQRRPTLEEPEPPLHDESTLLLPFRILEVYGVAEADRMNHVWNVHIRVFEDPRGRLQRKMDVVHMGRVIESDVS